MEAELLRNPADPYTCAKLGGLEISMGNRERGVALLRQGLESCPKEAHPERYELLLHLALALGNGDPAGTGKLYREALSLPLDPRLTLAARLNLASLLLQQGQTVESVAVGREATRIAPELARGWLHLALSLRRSGDLPGAIAAYHQALAIEPDQSEGHQNLGLALLLSGDVMGARRHLQQAINLLNAQGRSGEADALRRSAGTLVKLEP
jgi:tetratricopeptide (TPR) repeat protein